MIIKFFNENLIIYKQIFIIISYTYKQKIIFLLVHETMVDIKYISFNLILNLFSVYLWVNTYQISIYRLLFQQKRY
jgi:hypothetical protein